MEASSKGTHPPASKLHIFLAGNFELFPPFVKGTRAAVSVITQQ
jgi:hypothetical protein